MLKHSCLARGTSGDARAAGALFSSGDVVASPGPVGAAALSAKDVDVGAAGFDGTLDVLDGQASDGDAGSGLAGGRAVLVILLDDNTVLGNVAESDVLVSDAGD